MNEEMVKSSDLRREQFHKHASILGRALPLKCHDRGSWDSMRSTLFPLPKRLALKPETSPSISPSPVLNLIWICNGCPLFFELHSLQYKKMTFTDMHYRDSNEKLLAKQMCLVQPNFNRCCLWVYVCTHNVKTGMICNTHQDLIGLLYFLA